MAETKKGDKKPTDEVKETVKKSTQWCLWGRFDKAQKWCQIDRIFSSKKSAYNYNRFNTGYSDVKVLKVGSEPKDSE